MARLKHRELYFRYHATKLHEPLTFQMKHSSDQWLTFPDFKQFDSLSVLRLMVNTNDPKLNVLDTEGQ